MTDKTEHEILQGERAAQLLGDPLLIEAFEQIEQEYHKAWLESPVRDYEGREELYRLIRSLHAVHAKLVSVLDTGKVAKATLAQEIAEQARQLGKKLSPFS